MRIGIDVAAPARGLILMLERHMVGIWRGVHLQPTHMAHTSSERNSQLAAILCGLLEGLASSLPAIGAVANRHGWRRSNGDGGAWYTAWGNHPPLSSPLPARVSLVFERAS